MSSAGPGKNEVLIGVDLGTTGTKAGVFDLSGGLVAEAYVEAQLSYPRPGAVEQCQEDFYRDAVQAIAHCVRASGIHPDRVAAIAFASQMAGLGNIDEAWRPVRPYDSWLDLSSKQYVDEIDGDHGELVTRVDGCPPMANHAPRILRLLNEAPDEFGRIAKFVMPSAYVAGRMAGLSGADAFVDYTFLHFSGVADAQRGTWSDELCDKLGIPREKLPRIVTPWTIVGELTARAAARCGLRQGVPIAAGAGDQAAGALGAGIVEAGMIFDSAGTASVLATCVDRYAPDVANRTIVVSRSVLPGLWMPLAYVAGGGLCLRWFRDTLAAEELAQATAQGTSVYSLLDAQAAGVQQGADRLWFVPHLGGRTLPSQPTMRGSWVGFTWSHTRPHLYRAILESVAYEYLMYLGIQCELMPGVRFTEAHVIGGGARSQLWNQIKADVLGVPYVRLHRSELATWGAAMIAGHAVGLIDDLASTARQHAQRAAAISPNPEHRPAYEHMAGHYRSLLDTLGPFFADAQTIVD
jgi:xylulokinase